MRLLICEATEGAGKERYGCVKKRIIIAIGILLFVILFQGGALVMMLSQVRTADEALNDANTMTTEINAIEMQHYRWLQGLTLTLFDGDSFSGSLDPETCSLGRWLASDKVIGYQADAFHSLLDPLVEPHNQIHLAAADILNALEVGDTENAVSIYQNRVLPNMDLTIGALDAVNAYAEGVMKAKKQDGNDIYQLSTSFVIALVSLSLAIGVVMMIILIRRTVPPLKKLTKAATDLSVGNMEIEIEVHSKDELGDLAFAFQEMADGIKQQSEILNRISHCDYTMTMPIRSDRDVINQSINQMLDQNNVLLKELRAVSNNLAAGAQQIAAGSQSLATGSIEQTSALQLFSSSVSQIQTQAKENSVRADQTATEVGLAGRLMVECLAYMQEMQDAMKTIYASSKEIAKVSKLIEEIAFQTNILALNAAVEAAKAGQHGSGFSVVADEVRNLAGKSAVATNETKTLVDNSMQSILRGMEITEKTEVSLKKVGEIAERNVKAMEIISSSAEAQKASMDEITQGIEQISAVVQSNSDNAVESAASADHLTTQSEMMKNMVAQFQLSK